MLFPVLLDEMQLHHPVHLAAERHRVLLQPGEQVLPHANGLLYLRGESGGPGVAHHSLQVLPLDVKGRKLTAVGEPHGTAAGGVVRDLPDGADRVLQRQVAEHNVGLEHLQQGRSRSDLDERHVLRHVRIAGDHVETAIPLGVGMRFVARVDDGAAPRRRRGDSLPDMLGALCQGVDGAPCRLQQLACTRVDLSADEERDQCVDGSLEVAASANEIVLVATVGVPGRVGVVLEQVYLAANALFGQALLGGSHQILEDALPRLVVGDDVDQGVALGSRVLGVAPHIEI